MGKLDYSKWDNLELSDDSDIEVHPNVDKNSFIKWKQRDIHEKREMRKIERSRLEAEQRTNADIAPVIRDVIQETKRNGLPYYQKKVSHLMGEREKKGNADGPDGPTLDDILLSLLLQVNEEDKVRESAGTSDHADVIAAALERHMERLTERQTQITTELEKMEAEDARKITSDTLHDGWNSSHVLKEEEPEPRAPAPKKRAQQIETLNAGSTAVAKGQGQGSDSEEEEPPAVTPVMKSFASLPSALAGVPLTTTSFPAGVNPAKTAKLDAFEAMFQYLGSHKELLRESYGTADALLVQAFESQLAGQKALARMCTEKALLVQYCNKLGKDGVSLFFKRMTAPDGRAASVFLNDVLSTYSRIASRAEVLADQYKGEGAEQIQLVSEDPNTVISFDLPDGPPPDTITLEGEGVENMDVEQVRAWLQRRWEIFSAFDEDFRTALLTKRLNTVNAALGRMPVSKAEVVVQELDEAGILHFSSTEVRDETQGKPAP